MTFRKRILKNGRYNRWRIFGASYICIYNVGWLQCHKGINIKVGNGDLQIAAEVGTNFLTTTGQAIADSVESKKDKDKKAEKQ